MNFRPQAIGWDYWLIIYILLFLFCSVQVFPSQTLFFPSIIQSSVPIISIINVLDNPTSILYSRLCIALALGRGVQVTLLTSSMCGTLVPSMSWPTILAITIYISSLTTITPYMSSIPAPTLCSLALGSGVQVTLLTIIMFGTLIPSRPWHTILAITIHFQGLPPTTPCMSSIPAPTLCITLALGWVV